MKQGSGIILAGLLLVATVSWLVADAETNLNPTDDSYYRLEEEAERLGQLEDPDRALNDAIIAILESKLSPMAPTFSASRKRGLDLGFSRGFSGSRAGKHLMGLLLARFANGPGK